MMELNKVIVWGAKWRGLQLVQFIQDKLKVNVECFVDSNLELSGEMVEGKDVISPDTFFEEYNLLDVSVIVGCFDPIKEREIIETLNNNKFKGCIIGGAEFHNKYEMPYFCNTAKKRYEIEFDDKMDKWIKNILAEVEFWKNEVASKNGLYWNHYLDRIKPKQFQCERVSELIKENDIVLDVGCGICSQYGSLLNNHIINLKGIDPLAPFYNRINLKNKEILGLDFEIPQVEFGLFELLSYTYGNDYCDIILIDNALDHCIDPVNSIVECLKVLKIGGTLSTFHHIDEAYKAFYSDLHQWNVCCDENNCFILWNQDNYINVNELLKDYVEIKVEKSMILAPEIPFGGVICNIKKAKEIPDDFMNMGKQRAGVVLEKMMTQLSDLQYAIELLKLQCL